jgi:dTDP-4-dehydrorhamnose 3,5-epimerase
MEYKKTHIKDLFFIKPTVHQDLRGYFFESYNKNSFDQFAGKDIEFVQDNHSSSTKNTLRGIHLQKEPYAQGKLVRVIHGSVLDIAIDLRKESPTYLKYFSIELTAKNKLQLYIPEGFGHAFLALSDNANLAYKTTNFYKKDAEITIMWDDPLIGIDWPIAHEKLLISDKDKNGIYI